MKKITLLMVALLLGITGVKAEETVVVWNGTATDLAPWKSEDVGEKTLGVSYDDRDELANAYMKDVIKISFTMKEGESSYEIRLADPDGWKDMDGTTSNPAYASGTQTYTYTIENVYNLDVIQKRGILLRGNNVTITKVELTKVDDRYNALPIVIGEAGMATWSSNQHHKVIGDNVTVYYASAANEGNVTLTPITETGKENTIWYYQGYIVKGPQGVYEAKVIAEDDASYPQNNLLVGADGGAKVFKSKFEGYVFTEGDFWYGDDENVKTAQENRIKNMYRYIFAQKGTDDPAFYKLAEDYSRTKDETTVYYHDLGAHKAYLETTDNITPSESRVALVFDDGETTGIQELENSSIEELNHSGNEALKAYYNLNGQRVTNPKRGLYIVNGKKVIIK